MKTESDAGYAGWNEVMKGCYSSFVRKLIGKFTAVENEE